MAFDMGLSVDDTREVIAELCRSHSVSSRVQILDLEHNYKSNITEQVIDGQVTVNWDGEEATRGLELAVFDPDYDLGFDTSEFADGVWFFDRMVQVVIDLYVPALAREVSIPVFTGPVRGYKRKRAIVTIKCAGKDVFARGAWNRIILSKNTNYVTAIKTVLQSFGETKFRFEDTTTTVLKAAKTIDRTAQQSPWGWCRSAAASIGMRVFYDGEGYAVLRKKTDSTNPVFVFRDGNGGSVLTDPDSEGDYSRIANAVRVEGRATGKGAVPVAEAVVPATSPISPTTLKRGGKPMYFGVVVSRDSVTTTGQAKSVAQTELNDRQRAGYEVAFDSLPMFFLEEGDVVGVNIDGNQRSITLLTFSFGLSAGAVMPVGYKELVAPTLAKIRRF